MHFQPSSMHGDLIEIVEVVAIIIYAVGEILFDVSENRCKVNKFKKCVWSLFL